MQQPELGHKIQNWRKAKGLTQEELVEKCNLNVRTLQRIEAGEVLPRSYTIKSILEVLNVDFSELNMKKDHQSDFFDLIGNRRSYFKWGAIIGIIYLCLSFIEGFMEVGFYDENGNDISGINFSLVKIGVMLTFAVFYYPIYLIGKALDDYLLKISGLFLIVLIVISNLNDIAVFYTSYMSVESLLVVRSVMFGIGYILIGTAFVMRQKSLGTLSLIIGIFAIVTGLGFISVLMAVPALFTLTIFEILLLVLIVKAMNADGVNTEKTGDKLSSVAI